MTAEEIALQRHRWLSMEHVGDSRPVLRAFVRKGHLDRHYKQLPRKEVFGFIPHLLGPNYVWYGQWVADTDFVEIPAVKDAKGDQDYTQNGVERVTMTLDNIAMIQEEGNLGALFHLIERGYYSPQRGQPSNRGEIAGEKNAWFDTWKDGCTQIVIVAGYGEAVLPLHVGLVDKVRLTSRPDQIEVTMRNMGKFLTDQDVFLDAKNVWVRDPITFADRVTVQEGPNVANQANAKNHKPGAAASLAVDGNTHSACVSDEFSDPASIWWIEFPLPSGKYIKTEVFPAYSDMEMFISIFTSNENVPGGGKARFPNGELLGEGWLDMGQGNIPGTSIPFVNHIPGIRSSMTTYPVTYTGQHIISGDDTKIRLWFRHLHPAKSDNGKRNCYRAGVRECRIRDANIPATAKNNRWILVDDVANIIRMVLQWVGIEAEVEDTGVRLASQVVFGRDKKLIDIINYIKEQVSYVFYVKPPDDFDVTDLTKGNAKNLSMGKAVFRQSSSMKEDPPETIESVRDDNLLTGVEVEFDTVMPDSIRVRGTAVSDKIAKNDPAHIHPLGADRTKRFQASYRPVWARENSFGAANLRRPEVHYDDLLDSVYLCEVACLMIAYQAALSVSKGGIEIPMWPLIHLDHQTLLFDRGTGMSTRLWVVQRTWNWTGGENPEFKMNLAGSFIDVNDVAETRKELVRLLNDGGRMPAPIGEAGKVRTF